MTPEDILMEAIDPACALLENHGVHSGPEAFLWTLTISGQEAGWKSRKQNGGPARGLWQFEGGPLSATVDVFTRARPQLQAVCAHYLIPFNVSDIFEAIAWHDVLAASMARLLLWLDPAPLPKVQDVDGGWQYYLNNWRPGMPRPETWKDCYKTARGLLP